uniref:Uncharacterized protein n=1 Tax=Aegilops tauschii subsp. strangulata TaxID=200361 RepID=A0A452XC90_AEGTS
MAARPRQRPGMPGVWRHTACASFLTTSIFLNYQDAKEHLFALADKLGASLKDIDLTKSSPATADPSEQDYDEKAEDAVDYEDIDEQYDGPEVEAATEEDHLLSKKDYFSSNTMFASVSSKVSVFDEENYDEDEEPPNDIELPGDNVIQGLAYLYA